ncbi:MAG TPA: phosphoglycolate phosphatase [Alphaproteobacteria bacterium]|nr:phosphoglycolate phosphatase [Alphaproteobacteria bacterium]
MPAKSRFSAIVFDLDGTLVDSAPDLCGVVNQMLKRHGRMELDLEQIRKMVGDGAAKLIERGFAAEGLPAPLPDMTKEFIELYEARIADETRPFPGVVATLERLKAAGLRLGVCTNKTTRLSRKLLDELDLLRFFTSVVGGEGPARKPDPRHLQAVIGELAASEATTLMVGDSRNDVAAAKAAGVEVVAVSFGYTTIAPSDLGADRVIDRFDELGDVVFGA